MKDMQEEKEKAALLTNFVFGGGERKAGKRRGSNLSEDLGWKPKVVEVWFEIARNELKKRRLEQHQTDGLYEFPGVQGEVMVGCPGCRIPGSGTGR